MENKINPEIPATAGPAKDSILSKIVVPEGAATILTKAEQVVEQANLNEAIRIIERLEVEVGEMTMPARFSREKIVSNSPYHSINPAPGFEGVTEVEYKRQQLLVNLAAIKLGILTNISSLKGIVSDIEATKLEG